MKAGYSTPMLQVVDVEQSIRFYQLLRFKFVDNEGADGYPFGWARMHRQDCTAIMFLRGDPSIGSSPKSRALC